MVGNRAVGMSENMRGQVVNTGLLKEKVLLLFQPKSREGRGAIDPLALTSHSPTALGSNLLCQADCRSRVY